MDLSLQAQAQAQTPAQPPVNDAPQDVIMTEAGSVPNNTVSTPLTPRQVENVQQSNSQAGSRAPSRAHTPSRTTQAQSAPIPSPIANGSPTRRYLNTNVTPYLLEGVKYLAENEPQEPLKWLSEFLRQKSEEVEGK